MQEVYLSAHDAAAALGLSYYTVCRYAKARRFPNARLRDNNRRKGYRIPDGDILAYALVQGQDVVRQAEEVIAQVRARQEAVKAAS